MTFLSSQKLKTPLRVVGDLSLTCKGHLLRVSTKYHRPRENTKLPFTEQAAAFTTPVEFNVTKYVYYSDNSVFIVPMLAGQLGST